MLIGGWGKQTPASGKPGTTPGSSTVGVGRGANKQNNKSPTDVHLFFMLELVLAQVNHQPQIVDTFRGAAVSGLARADDSQHFKVYPEREGSRTWLRVFSTGRSNLHALP